jgi:hypothetical protein
MAFNQSAGIVPMPPAKLPTIGPTNIQQALNDHVLIKRSTEILLHCGCKDKDTISTHFLVEWVEKAAKGFLPGQTMPRRSMTSA